LISPGEIKGIIDTKIFYTIKSKKHELSLQKMERTINPEDNNKRIMLDNYTTVPYGYLNSEKQEQE
jgi:hypothetical protein